MALPSEEIKEKLDVVTVLKDYLDLRPAGRNFKANCPFHQEKSPSFIVSPERGIWHCFGCGEGGDIFKFVMKYENIEFYEALKILAEKAGIELRRLSPTDQKQFGVLYDINSAALRFWNEALEESKRAKEYLAGRGLKRETIAEFEVGYADSGFDTLTLHLIKEKFDIGDAVRAGLIFKTDKGKYIDRFRGRVMFPIHNHFGKVVGFSGRILPELENPETGKYINSPETPIFNKSKLLYGYWKSKNFIRDEKTVLLVEGQMDFLMMWQAGVRNLVATSGTALTVDHLKVLKKLADNILITFDKDEAGKLAAERAIDLAGAADLGAFVLDLGDYKDPAEVAEKEPELISQIIAKPIPAMDYYFARYLGKGNVVTKEGVRTLLRKIKNLWSAIDQSSWLSELSHRTGVPTKDLTEELEKLEFGEISVGKLEEPALNPTEFNKGEFSRLEHIALRALSLISINEELGKLLSSHIELIPPRYKGVYLALGGEKVVLDNESKSILDMVSMRSSLEAEMDTETTEKELNKLLKELQLEYWKDKRRVVSREILQAEVGGTTEELLIKLKEFDDISKKLQYIENAQKN